MVSAMTPLSFKFRGGESARSLLFGTETLSHSHGVLFQRKRLPLPSNCKVFAFSEARPPVLRLLSKPCLRVKCQETHSGTCLRRSHGGEEDAGFERDFQLQNTQRLVECAMYSAVTGLAYFLSNSLRIENYFSCFFTLPLLISSMRWDIAAARKTMLSTTMLLLVLCGPLKATSYMLVHGSLGLSMGILWRLETSWGFSILICSLVRSIGAIGTILLSSWILRENIFSLIMINAHATLSHVLAAAGINVTISMEFIYVIFASLLLINSTTFVFLLHVLHAIFLRRLGIPVSISHPGWLKRTL